MKTVMKLLGAAAALAACVSLQGCDSRPDTKRGNAGVLRMTAVPDGHYLLNLQTAGIERRVNIEVKANSAHAVSSTESDLKDFAGKFELIGNGVFSVTFQNQQFTASQWWLFQEDGSAIVKEVPDRGEKERAVPVADESVAISGGSHD